jgi:hypothetical protein
VRRFDGCVEGGGRRHWVDEAGARWRRAYSKLSLFAVEVCKIELDTVSVAQDMGHGVRIRGGNRDRTGGVQGLHVNLMLSSCDVDQTKAAVLSCRMMGEYGREEEVLVGSRFESGWCPRWVC